MGTLVILFVLFVCAVLPTNHDSGGSSSYAAAETPTPEPTSTPTPISTDGWYTIKAVLPASYDQASLRKICGLIAQKDTAAAR